MNKKIFNLGPNTKFLIVGDLHGVKPNIYFKKKDFDAIIFPGDVCSDKELRAIEKKWIASWGTSKTPHADWEKFMKKFGKRKYAAMQKRSIEEGKKILQYLDSLEKPIFFIPGNWDKSYGKSKIKNENMDKDPYLKAKNKLDMMYGKTNKKLIKGIKNVIDCQLQKHEFKGFNIIGYGLTNSPEKPNLRKIKNKEKRKKAMKAYNKIFNKLKTLHDKRNKNKPTIFLSHNMPHNTKMDKIIAPGSPVDGKHYGSTISKEFIKRHQPLVCIGGHMHEYLGKEKIGKTTVINAGYGSQVNTLLEIKNGKIKKITFICKDKKKGVNKKIGWR